jgi:hypothetical protein
MASRQLEYSGALAERAASISAHASELCRSGSFSPEALVEGEMTAIRRPRFVTATVAPARTLRKTAPVRFLSSLAVTDCMFLLLLSGYFI